MIGIKQRIQKAQTKAILSANSELISMFWDIGKMFVQKQKLEGWVLHLFQGFQRIFTTNYLKSRSFRNGTSGI